MSKLNHYRVLVMSKETERKYSLVVTAESMKRAVFDIEDESGDWVVDVERIKNPEAWELREALLYRRAMGVT